MTNVSIRVHTSAVIAALLGSRIQHAVHSKETPSRCCEVSECTLFRLCGENMLNTEKGFKGGPDLKARRYGRGFGYENLCAVDHFHDMKKQEERRMTRCPSRAGRCRTARKYRHTVVHDLLKHWGRNFDALPCGRSCQFAVQQGMGGL